MFRFILHPSTPVGFLVVGIAYILGQLTLQHLAPSPLSLLRCLVALQYFWAGIALLSVVHAWIKFKAPSLPKWIAFDVGRVLFATSSLMEMWLALSVLNAWIELLLLCSPVAPRFFNHLSSVSHLSVTCHMLTYNGSNGIGSGYDSIINVILIIYW